MQDLNIEKALFQAERHGQSTVTVMTRDLRELLNALEEARECERTLALASQKSAPPQE